jgi:hypothetical protein
VSDHDFRGISPTAAGRALLSGIEFSVGGLRPGMWGSDIAWGPAYDGHMALDVQGDYLLGSDATAMATLGVVARILPRMRGQNTVEPLVTISKRGFSGSIHDTADCFPVGNAWYCEVNGIFAIGNSGSSAAAHIGRSTGDAPESRRVHRRCAR